MHMDVRDNSLPDDPEELKRLLLEQQLQFAQQQHNARIEILEEQLKLLRLHQFGKRSEKLFNPDQWQLFNEPEIIADEPGSDHGDASEEDETISVPGHTRMRDSAPVAVMHCNGSGRTSPSSCVSSRSSTLHCATADKSTPAPARGVFVQRTCPHNRFRAPSVQRTCPHNRFRAPRPALDCSLM